LGGTKQFFGGNCPQPPPPPWLRTWCEKTRTIWSGSEEVDTENLDKVVASSLVVKAVSWW